MFIVAKLSLGPLKDFTLKTTHATNFLNFVRLQKISAQLPCFSGYHCLPFDLSNSITRMSLCSQQAFFQLLSHFPGDVLMSQMQHAFREMFYGLDQSPTEIIHYFSSFFRHSATTSRENFHLKASLNELPIQHPMKLRCSFFQNWVRNAVHYF